MNQKYSFECAGSVIEVEKDETEPDWPITLRLFVPDGEDEDYGDIYEWYLDEDELGELRGFFADCKFE